MNFPTPASKRSFDLSIQEAESVLRFYDELNDTNQRAKELEVLKRAGLIMALTAWETYVEDRIEESVSKLLAPISGTSAARFISARLCDELKRFHTPNSEKTKKFFSDYLDIDISQAWSWNQYDLPKVKAKLDDLVARRGEAAHRAKSAAAGFAQPDLIKIDELRKSINFLKKLVEVTDSFIEPS